MSPTGRYPRAPHLAAMDIVRTLAWPPVPTAEKLIIVTDKAAGKEVSLPRYCHPCSQRAGRELRVDTEQAVPIISGFLKHDPADLDTRIESAAHARFQRGAVQSVGPLHIRQLVEWQRCRFPIFWPIIFEIAISPPPHPLVLHLRERQHRRITQIDRQPRHVTAFAVGAPQSHKDPATYAPKLWTVIGE